MRGNRRKEGQLYKAEEDKRVVARMFVPFPPNGEVETDIEKQTGTGLIIMEISGIKLMDSFHKYEGAGLWERRVSVLQVKQRTRRNNTKITIRDAFCMRHGA